MALISDPRLEAVKPAALATVTVARPFVTVTRAVALEPAVVTEVPFTRGTPVPSMPRISDAPSETWDTVKVNCRMVCPGSTVDAAALENSRTDAAPCMKVGLSTVALSVGGSLTACTATEVLALPTPPLPSSTVTPIDRAVGFGASELSA